MFVGAIIFWRNSVIPSVDKNELSCLDKVFVSVCYKLVEFIADF